ncbi:zinc-binding alcohol dehydrogenase family protein [Lysinibacillus sp. FSL M8-0216]|uniref:Zinc-type alcohol dehydrogenase-like protein n=1 Tax=Lysinibacillus fusiformis TaxID=28031 RepID=A0A1H9AN57_9BACI|nr:MULTISPECIES: zinc-binding alcohol dehydrogenase family protein [Lysinibacillus]MCG7436049.1 zinc-binding alcohol dehydrogenase family protein [Lysinibacillus fusiformis]MED4669709.1 zinc-binding alcohol dehydrogenase family protein [Lysinibacillus fusiformis]QAS55789.1 zinc-binding alcohol dehydrogenase family protein [Lysinibacillus sphaericus]RDV27863.1 zinc-binding alcohol dehydrogenase family protein [Lysinibacillus fusiformis]SCX42616.1 zinc-binding alcohol dehydrogenase family protei
MKEKGAILIMEKMKAVGLHQYLPVDQPESLLDLQIAKPSVKDRDLLIKVKAVSVNPVDYKVRTPKEKFEDTPKILGWDVAGIVVESGPLCTLFKPGDEVYYAGDITRQGCNSEFHLVDERIVGHKPKSLNFAESAALPLTSITAYEAIFDRMKVSSLSNENKNKTILIIGAAGGVGSIAIQLAKWAGLTVIGTASRQESRVWATDLGADYIINHYEEFIPQLKIIGFEAVDYILCLNSTQEYWANMAEAIAPQGTICSIVETDEPINLTLLKNKSVTFVWEFMFTRSMYQTEDMNEQHKLLNRIAILVDSNILKTTISEILYPINADNLRKAHAILENGKTIGKIVLEGFK